MAIHHVRAGRTVGTTALVAVASTLSLGATAHAADPTSYACRASAVTTQLAGGAVADPLRASNDTGPCAEAAAGLPQAAGNVGLDDRATARTAYATTTPGGARPMSATPRAAAGVEGLTVAIGGTLSVGAAQSSVTASCRAGAPVYTRSSQVGDISLAGRALVVDGVVQPVPDALTQALGAVVSVKLDEQVDLAGGGKAVRAAHITLPAGSSSGAPVADVIVAESRLSSTGAVCDPSAAPNTGGAKGGNGGGNAGGGAGSGSGAADTSGLCPSGSVLDARRKLCVIPAPGTRTAANPLGDLSGAGAVPVGKPFDAPRGGGVLALVVARKRYPASPCVRGKGVRYVVLGTAGGDRITGTNKGDRILGRGGSDRLDGGRGNDCVDGMRGRDTVTGGQGNDRVFGHAGNDHVNGDSGTDRLLGGAGDDSLNAGYGADRVFGGPGRDAINVATAGPRQLASGGKGYDVVRMNPEDRVRGAERMMRVVRVKG